MRMGMCSISKSVSRKVADKLVPSLSKRVKNLLKVPQLIPEAILAANQVAVPPYYKWTLIMAEIKNKMD